MTTKPRVRKFRIRKSAPLIAAPVATSVSEAGAATAPEAVSGAVSGAVSAPASAARTASPAQADPQPQRRLIAPPDRNRTGDAFWPVDGEAPGDIPGAEPATTPSTDIDAIRQEGLTGRQLRMARRAAQKHGLTIESDFDAVRQLRARGADPFARSNILQLVPPSGAATTNGDRVQLPQTVPQGTPNLPSTERISPSERRAGEILTIQRDLARRRRKKTGLLLTRLAMFVMLPTLLAGWYFYQMATPMFATESEFLIQQAEPAGAAGLGGMFQGTSLATKPDSLAVQSYLTSRAALLRLEEEHGFREAFAGPEIDPLQRLPPDASIEAAFGVYRDHVRISFDPTEGIIRMEVIAPDPALSLQWSNALIDYAEEQVDQLTQRLREDQMEGAQASYEAAEGRRSDSLAEWLQIQTEVQQIDPVGETAARTAQISALETEQQQLMLALQERQSVARPNEAQVENLETQIANIAGLIAGLRQSMTSTSDNGASLAAKNTELRVAEENYAFHTLQVQQALQQMETARIEANRQVRYLSLGVVPVAPDEATYPKAFENTLLSFLVFAGIYLMLSLTASILREQVTA